MNKISALEAYKASVIIEDVTKFFLNHIDYRKTGLFRYTEVKHGRGDDRNEVRRDLTSYDLTKGFGKELRNAS